MEGDQVDRASDGWRGLVLGGLLLVVALALRLPGLAGGLLQDEFGTLWVVEGSLGEVFSRTLAFHGQSPFYYVFPWATLQLTGESEWALRASSVLFGALTCGVLYLVGREARGPSLGVIMALIAALLPYTVRFSAQARPYALGGLLLSLAYLGLFRAVRSGAPRDRALLVLGAVGAFYSHYLLATGLIGVPVALLAARGGRSRYATKQALRDAGLGLLLTVPGCVHFASIVSRRDELAHISAPGYLQGLKVLSPCLALVAVAWSWRVVRRRPVALGLHAWAAGLSVVLGLLGFCLLALACVHLITERYLFGLIVASVILAGLAVDELEPPARNALLASWVLALGGYYGREASLHGTFNLLGRAADWRGAMEVVESARREQPAPPVLFRSGFVEDLQLPFKRVSPCIRAPLRSPGRPPAGPDFVPLCRWSEDPHTLRYLEVEVRPHAAGTLLLICPRAELPPPSFLDWLERVTGRGYVVEVLLDRGNMTVRRLRPAAGR